MKKKDIRTLSESELEDFFEHHSLKPFHGKQVYHWLWKKGVHSFDEMTNISNSSKELLGASFVINHIKIDKFQKSVDGTIKNSVRLHDGYIVESVLIPSYKRITACISSQVGCSLDCRFCATSRLKRMRNLNVDEIYDQVTAINNQSQIYHNKKITNIVFMGMGEPLMNYNNVKKAIDKICSKVGLGMSPRRIVLSTSGIPKMIKKIAQDQVKFNLAISLHSAIDKVRNEIMPFTKNFPLKDLSESIELWYNKTRRKVTYEYIVWKGINDRVEDILALIEFCKAVPCKVNLIEYNPILGGFFQQANSSIIQDYLSMLQYHNITVTVRKSRGKDIDAACGQLANKG